MSTPDLAVVTCPHPHGDYRRYCPRKCHEPCRCSECRAANARVHATSKAAHKAGTPPLVDAGPVRERIAEWRDARSTWPVIAAATGMDEKWLQRIHAGRTSRVLAIHAEIVLSTHIDPPPPAALRRGLVDATKTRRQVQALMAVNYSTDFIAAKADTWGCQLARIAGGERDAVTSKLADRMDVVYDELCTAEGTHPLTGARALRRGYAPPDAWTDETIGDPNARPWGHLRQLNSRTDVEWVTVYRICSGRYRYTTDETTIAERDEVVRTLHARRLNDQEIADITGWPDRTIIRIRERLELPSNALFVLATPARRRGTQSAHLARLRRRYRAACKEWSAVVKDRSASPADRAEARMYLADARTSLADLAIAAAPADLMETAA